MRTIVESLKRLYLSGKLTMAKISERLAKKTITPEEYVYIVEGKK